MLLHFDLLLHFALPELSTNKSILSTKINKFFDASKLYNFSIWIYITKQ